MAATYTRGPLRCVTRVARVGSRSGPAGESLPAYYLMDVRGFYDAGWATLFVGAENVFDVLYEDEEGFPAAGPGVRDRHPEAVLRVSGSSEASLRSAHLNGV